MSKLTDVPEKGTTRHVGAGLVVRITEDGIYLRGRRRRERWFLKWEEVCYTACKKDPPSRGWSEKQWANARKMITWGQLSPRHRRTRKNVRR